MPSWRETRQSGHEEIVINIFVTFLITPVCPGIPRGAFIIAHLNLAHRINPRLGINKLELDIERNKI